MCETRRRRTSSTKQTDKKKKKKVCDDGDTDGPRKRVDIMCIEFYSLFASSSASTLPC